jgi:hypothetical protein
MQLQHKVFRRQKNCFKKKSSGFIQSSWSNIIVLGNEDWSLATIAAAGA